MTNKDMKQIYNIICDDIYGKVNCTYNFQYVMQVRQANKNTSGDFLCFSEQYLKTALICRSFIAINSNDNNIIDAVGLVMLYMYRHSLELIIKSKILAVKGEIIAREIFENLKHSLSGLVEVISESFDDELYTKLKKYLTKIDEFDKSSDLFRYPFKYSFLVDYRDKSLNIWEMSSCLNYVYNVLYKTICNKQYSEFNDDSIKRCEEILNKNGWEYLILATSGYNNCYLWQLYSDNDCYKQLKGYKFASKLLYYNSIFNGEKDTVFPMLFCHRHMVEVAIKKYGYLRSVLLKNEVELYSNEKFKNKFIYSHELNNDVYKYVKPILEYTKMVDCLGESYEREEHNILKKDLDYLSTIDKKGDFFRYPTDKLLRYNNYNGVDINAFCSICDECRRLIEEFDIEIEFISDRLNEMNNDI